MNSKTKRNQTKEAKGLSVGSVPHKHKKKQTKHTQKTYFNACGRLVSASNIAQIKSAQDGA